MAEAKYVREELDRCWDHVLKAEDAILAQRRRSKELESVYAEERAANPALPPSLRR